MSDIDIAVVDSLKVLDPRRPIREADMHRPFKQPKRLRQSAKSTRQFLVMAIGFRRAADAAEQLGAPPTASQHFAGPAMPIVTQTPGILYSMFIICRHNGALGKSRNRGPQWL